MLRNFDLAHYLHTIHPMRTNVPDNNMTRYEDSRGAPPDDCPRFARCKYCGEELETERMVLVKHMWSYHNDYACAACWEEHKD